ncbi:MAG: hypothetical protein VYA51_05215, partial [Planctomycetota bacterium]|nr:hypothetical protein [Planctomycetota bacterium]
MIHLVFAAGIGLFGSPAFLSPQAPADAAQDPATQRYDRLVAEANRATAAWSERVAALRTAELKGGDPVPADAWDSPLEVFIPRFVAAAKDYAGKDAAIPYLKWVAKTGMPMLGAGREAAKASLKELVTTHRASSSLDELEWMLGRMVYFFGEEEGRQIAAGLRTDSPNAKVRTWAVFSLNSGALESDPVEWPRYTAARQGVRAARAAGDPPMLAAEVENPVAVRAPFSGGRVA